MNILIASTPFLLQGLIISVDEFYSHKKRGLSKAEMKSHIIDTSLLMLSLSFVIFTPRTTMNESIFYVLALASCLVVTKDEWIHAKECDGFESWLHALLFLLHPLVLVSAFLNWGQSWLLGPLAAMSGFLAIQLWGLFNVQRQR